ncbi:emp24/gp25L/p24 family protein [Candidatus Bathyarchaeota archaeon]|nr:emp24/gp25L/p24 family protein [Candidatus Bathyarchaeota archaeon]
MKLSGLGAIAVILFLISTFSLARASNVEVVSVGPLATRTLTFNLNQGQRFSGSLSISGGSGNDIDFWVTNSVGATILNLGRVSQGRQFAFTADRDGGYTLHFGNTFSLISTKTVTLTYDVALDWSAPMVLGISPYSLLAIVLATVIIVVGVLVIVRISRKDKQKITQPLPPPG